MLKNEIFPGLHLTWNHHGGCIHSSCKVRTGSAHWSWISSGANINSIEPQIECNHRKLDFNQKAVRMVIMDCWLDFQRNLWSQFGENCPWGQSAHSAVCAVSNMISGAADVGSCTELVTTFSVTFKCMMKKWPYKVWDIYTKYIWPVSWIILIKNEKMPHCRLSGIWAPINFKFTTIARDL